MKSKVDELNTTLQKKQMGAKKVYWSQQKSLLANNIITVLKKFLSKCFEVPRGTHDS